MHNLLKDELFNIISGKSQISNGTIIQAIASYLKHGSQTSIEIENSKQVKEQETKLKLSRWNHLKIIYS